MNERALLAVQQQREKFEAAHPSIEERHEDEDWVQAVLDEAYYLFWLDEEQAWRWLVPRYVEGLVYSRDVRRGLLNVAREWKESLSAEGRRRLKMLQEQEGSFSFYDQSLDPDQLEQLTRLEQRGWLAGEGDGERHAIMAWQRGKLLYRGKEYAQALHLYKQAELGLPQEGGTLKEMLAAAFEELGRAISEGEQVIASPIAFQAFEHSLVLNPDQPYLLHDFAIQQELSGQYEDALENYLKRHRMAPPSATSWRNLGLLHHNLARYEEAIASYQQAIELDPQAAIYHNDLGNAYDDLGRYEEAIAAYHQAIRLDPQFALPHNNLGGIYMVQGRLEEAMYELNERVRLEPNNAFTPLTLLGTIARHLGLPESRDYFQRALEGWETAWRVRWQTSAGLLKNKATALICLGQKGEALQTLSEAIEQMLPGEIIDFEGFRLLQTAPEPPNGIEQMTEMLKAAEERRKNS
jgi:tetratricopeptide (TPR) repeat protein